MFHLSFGDENDIREDGASIIGSGIEKLINLEELLYLLDRITILEKKEPNL